MPDLASVIAPLRAAGNASMYQGTVVAYNGGSINVNVSGMPIVDQNGVVTGYQGGTVLTGIPYLDSYLPTVGDPVALLAAGNAYMCLGKASTGASQLAPAAQSVAAKETTSSATYTDLTTPGPAVTVNVPATGRVLVHYSAEVGWSDGTVDAADGGFFAVDVSGANTIAPDDNLRAGAFEQILGTTASNMEVAAGRSYAFTGLAPGATTFTMKYRSAGAGKPIDFGRRTLSAEPN